MTVFLSVLAQWAPGFYIVCLIGSAVYAFMAVTEGNQRRTAQFIVAREEAASKASRAWFMSMLFLGLGGVIFVTSSYIFPLIPLLAPETPAIEIGLLTATPTSTVVPTAQLTPTATGTATAMPIEGVPTDIPTATPSPTPTPPAPEAYQPDCPSPSAQVIAPVAGSVLDGVVEIRGTATVNAFSFYKFEVEFPGSDYPTFIGQYNTAVDNGTLGAWDVSDRTIYPSGGPYRFRLMVVDIYGNTTLCVIPVNLGAQP